MSAKIVLKPEDFFEKNLPKGLLVFFKGGKSPMAMWLTAADMSIAATVHKDGYDELVYVVRQEVEEILESFKPFNFKVRGKIVDDHAHIVRLYGNGRIQLSKDDSKDTVKSVLGNSKLRVLVVDDSPTMRTLLEKCLLSSGKFEIAASTGEPKKVKELLKIHKPDVMTLDIHMPDMNGVELWQSLTKEERVPSVLVSSLSMEEGSLVIQGLELGAFDYIKKPNASEIKKFGEELTEKLILAGLSRAKKRSSSHSSADGKIQLSPFADLTQIIAIGASTGGTEAIKNLITRWPANIPPVLIVQHIPPYFSKAFADRLNQLCEFEVKEAQDGDDVIPGRALIAPGGLQMAIVGKPGRYKVSVKEGELMSGHKPSVDFLFHSVAKHAKDHAVGIILTGMGKDGAEGLLAMSKEGAFTLGQDEDTSVVYGMPKAAKLNGAVKIQLPLNEISQAAMDALIPNKRKKPA